MIACKLSTPELQQRKTEVITVLKNLVLSSKELPDGYKYFFQYSDDTFDQLSSFVKTERVCCDFFQFTLQIKAEEIVFDIQGPDGAKEFLKEEIGF